MKAFFKGKFFYQLYFQTPGVAEAEFDKDVRTALRKFYHMASGELDLSTLVEKSADDDMLTSLTDPDKMGDWLTADDLDFYVNEFTQSGFAGPLNYYRNHNLTWELNANKPTLIHQPALFVAGERDGVIAMAGPALESMPNFVKDLRSQCTDPQDRALDPTGSPRDRERVSAELVGGIGLSVAETPTQKMNVERGVFHDLTVVDVSGSVATSYAAKLFADYGAVVVNLEPGKRLCHQNPVAVARQWRQCHACIPAHQQAKCGRNAPPSHGRTGSSSGRSGDIRSGLPSPRGRPVRHQDQYLRDQLVWVNWADTAATKAPTPPYTH
jgi:hypothetical protein